MLTSHVVPSVYDISMRVSGREWAYLLSVFEKKKSICDLQLPREPHRSSRLLQLTGRLQYPYDGIM